MYALGIDLGTTFTAAATWREGHAEVASLGSRAAVIPSVVLLRDDETVLTGEAADRRGLSEPHRVAREFKRRFGDTTPILLGGTPYSAEALSAKLLRGVIDDVAEREGGPPSRVAISHPANWGPYKRDLLDQVVRLANVSEPVVFTTEPEAAAAFYAQQQRIDPGALVAVYDLGGGTFDATVLSKTADGFEILGQPEGVERLGGIDFDAAVFEHVRRALGAALEELDQEDAAAVAAVARLREECVEAKEALSSDTDTSIPVLLPNRATEVRLTRAELEAMVRPTLYGSIEALRRALDSAEVAPDQLHSVLLVGGSSRMPLVAQLVGAELGRPVAVDAHPKHAVALGAAWLASREPMVEPVPTDATRTPTVAAVGAAAAAGAAPTSAATEPEASDNDVEDTGPVPIVGVSGPPPPVAPVRRARRPGWQAVAAAAALAVVAGAGYLWWASRPPVDDDTELVMEDGSDTEEESSEEPADVEAQDQDPLDEDEPALPEDEQCTEEIMSNERWVCLVSATFLDGELMLDYEAEWAGSVPDNRDGFHLHIWGSDGSDPPGHTMGRHVGDERGEWVIKDRLPAVLTADEVERVIGDHPKVCARIGNSAHELVPDRTGEDYVTGNCVPIER